MKQVIQESVPKEYYDVKIAALQKELTGVKIVSLIGVLVGIILWIFVAAILGVILIMGFSAQGITGIIISQYVKKYLEE